MPSPFKLARILVLVIVAGIAVGLFLKSPETPSHPQPSLQTGTRPPDTEPWQENMARGQLLDLHRNCQRWWDQEDTETPCAIYGVSEPPYDFRPHPVDWEEGDGTVEVTIENGDRARFLATARHENSPVTWAIDRDGKFTCSLGSASACEAAIHLDHEVVLKEVREYGGVDVPESADYMEVDKFPPVFGKN